MLRSGQFFQVFLQVSRLSNGVAPTGPIYAEPVIPLDAGLALELEFSEWRAAVGFGGALDFLETVQFGHRHSFQVLALV